MQWSGIALPAIHRDWGWRSHLPLCQRILDKVRIADLARRHYADHGLTDEDVLHALRNFTRRHPQTGDYEDRLLPRKGDYSKSSSPHWVTPNCYEIEDAS